MNIQETVKTKKRELLTLMVDKETHHIIKILAAQKNIKMVDLVYQVFNKKNLTEIKL